MPRRSRRSSRHDRTAGRVYRYVALIWESAHTAQAAAAAQLIAALRTRSPEWVCLSASEGLPGPSGQATPFADPAVRADPAMHEAADARPRPMDLAIFHAGARPGVSDTVLLPEHGGAIFGTLFRSEEDEPRSGAAGAGIRTVRGHAQQPGLSGACGGLAAQEQAAVVRSGGASLLASHWGRYVAVVRQPSGRVFVLRDPTGALPCLLAGHHGVWVLFSDVEDVLALGMRPSVNWPYVAALLADFALQTRETGLEQITEVQPGEVVELCGDTLARRLLWEPLRIARTAPIESPAVAARALREAARQCVHGWASRYPRILHRLSGGLDSTIVLAALRDAPAAPEVTCIHYFGSGPQEDERAFARRAAASAGCRLIEQPHEPEHVRLEAALHVARAARPYFYLYPIEHGRLEAHLAASLGATALFSGAGGDGLFYRNRAELAAADYLRMHGPRPELLRVALDAAIIERASVWSVLGTALRRHPRAGALSIDGRERRMRRAARAEGRNARDGQPRRFVHPWLEGMRRAPPGKVWQIRSIGSPLPYYDPLGRPEDAEAVQPLLSQPLIELSLRIPTYTLVSGGWDRAIARRAFAREIPHEIVRRRAKGASTAAAQRVFDTNLPFLRELLLDGVLVRERLLDRGELERTLAPRASLRDTGFIPVLLQHLATEAWLRRWLGN